MKSLAVNKIKKGGSMVATKIVWKIQNSLFNRNIRDSFDGLIRNQLLAQVRLLSHENQLAQELKNKKDEAFKLREESFS